MPSVTIFRWRVRAVVLLAVVAVSASSPAWAAETFSELATKLRSAKDFRVRTQAALALGVSKKAAAVAPLCSGLNDDNVTVRAASAAALGKLSKGGGACISRRLQREKNPKVQRMLTKVLRRFEGAPPPGIGPQTKYYVAIGPTSNKTERRDAEVDRMVRRHLSRELSKESSLALAPEGESESAAEKLLSEHEGVKSLFIWPKVLSESTGSSLRIKFSFTLFSYPDKAFKGSMSKSARVSGGRSDSLEDIEQLMQTLAPAIVRNFLSNLDRLQ